MPLLLLASFAFAEDAAPTPAPVVERPRNADLTVTMTWADGKTRSGKVTGIERSADFYGDQGWTAEEGKIKLEVDDGKKMAAWKDVKTITITPGSVKDDVDCTYSSDFTPWMYECTLRTNAAIVLKDGSKGTVTNRHLWRFHFEEGGPQEFPVFKYTEREQDEGKVEFGIDVAENTALYTRLQDQIRNGAKVMLKTISVQ